MTIGFGSGVVDRVDPGFVDVAAHDFHLRSASRHWTEAGYVVDPSNSPALAAGDPNSPVDAQPDRAGPRSELGAYGNTAEASYTR